MIGSGSQEANVKRLTLLLAVLGLLLAACGSPGNSATGAAATPTAAARTAGGASPTADAHGAHHPTPTEGDAAGAPTPGTGGAGMPGMGDMEPDRMFIAGMIPHHQSAIDMAKVARTKAEHPEIKRLADQIISSQQGEIDQMRAWHERWYGTDRVPEMDHEMMGRMMPGMDMHDMGMEAEDLSGAKPFDRAFIDAMIPHHEGAITMARHIRSRAERPEIKRLADEIISSQEGEIGRMRRWREAWYGAAATPERPVEGSVWVANERGDSITVLDAGTEEPVTTLTGIEGPHNLQVAPDGRSVWAVSGHESLAVMIDAKTYEVRGAVPTGKSPAHVIVTPDGRAVYVTNGDDDTVTAIDAATMKAVATIPVGRRPHGLRPSPDGRWVYVANAEGTTVSAIDTASNKRVADVEVGRGPVQVAFSPDGGALYVTLGGEDAVAKVDVATRKLVGKVGVGDGPIQLHVTPDGERVLAANQGTERAPGSTVSVIEADTLTVTSTIETGEGAHGVVVEPSGRRAYVANIYADNVAVLDLAERKVVATVAAGDAPNGISYSPLPAPRAAGPEIRLSVPQGKRDGDGHGDGHGHGGH
jgi:YVTN family beta-propeller protein